MRRLHSLFTAFSPAFNPRSRFPASLRQLQKQTNYARDLEVTLALMKKSPFQLTWLEHQWRDELISEYSRLRRVLPQTWETLSGQLIEPMELMNESLPETRLGSLAAQLLADKATHLNKKCKRLCKKWDEKAAHMLRISGKQTRYLLEPFIEDSLSIQSAVMQLKNFQDLLGDYHDIVVLRQQLKQLRPSASYDQKVQLKSAIQQLKRQRNILRKRFIRTYCSQQGKRLASALQQTGRILEEC